MSDPSDGEEGGRDAAPEASGGAGACSIASAPAPLLPSPSSHSSSSQRAAESRKRRRHAIRPNSREARMIEQVAWRYHAQNAGVEGDELELCGLPSALASTGVGQPDDEDERKGYAHVAVAENDENDENESNGNDEEPSRNKRIRCDDSGNADAEAVPFMDFIVEQPQSQHETTQSESKETPAAVSTDNSV